jgi:hypothetical protein
MFRALSGRTRRRGRGPHVGRPTVRATLLALVAGFLSMGFIGYDAPLASPATGHPGTEGGKRVACSGAPQREAPSVTVPVTLVEAPGGRFPTISVCVGTHGPYSFVVDTGSSRSIIDSTLARVLHFAGTGSARLGGNGCVTTGRLVKVPALDAGTLVLRPQVMVRSTLSDWDTMGVEGVLGSDVLGRFKALRLDPSRRTLTLLGNEGARPTANSIVTGRSTATPPSALVTGRVVDTVPLTIVTSPHSVAAFANVTVAGQPPYAWVVASGAPRSTIDKTAGFTFQLGNTSTAPAPAGVGCSGSVPVLIPGTLTMGSLSNRLSLLTVPIPGRERVGIIGYLGLDFLGAFGPVIIDYAGAEMSFLSK